MKGFHLYSPALCALMCFSILLVSCASSNRVLSYTPSNPSEPVFAKIKRDVIAKAVESGGSLGYSPISIDQGKGFVHLQKNVLGSHWNVVVNCAVISKEIEVTIYSPDTAGPVSGGGAHDIERIHAALMKLYQQN